MYKYCMTIITFSEETKENLYKFQKCRSWEILQISKKKLHRLSQSLLSEICQVYF